MEITVNDSFNNICKNIDYNFAMNNANILYDKLKKGEPFCFIKLNDGEIKALNPNNIIISRGDERSSLLLSEKIKESLIFMHENYFIGLPCIECNRKLCIEALQIINKYSNISNTNILNANILINTNVDFTVDVLSNVLEKIHISNKTTQNIKNIIIVSNTKNLSNIHNLAKFNIYPTKFIEVSEQYSFEKDYLKIKDAWKTFNNNDIILCLCGPLGRILSYEWFKHNNTLTCLELGSLFDPLLRNKSYLYHTGIHQYCSTCYPSNDSEDCLLIKNTYTTLDNECYYFYNEDNNFAFYQNNINKIKKNNDIRLLKEPNNSFLLNIKKKCCEIIKQNIINLQLYDCSYNEIDYNFNYNKYNETSFPFYIVYHIAIIDNKWKEITQSSYNKLIKSGILYDKMLKGIKISFLGDENNIQELKNIWIHNKVEIINNGMNYNLYEYPALQLIKNISNQEKNECYILYFKYNNLLCDNKNYIDYLEYFNIERYKHSIKKLKDYDVVSCNYYPNCDDVYYVKKPFYFTLFNEHYNGNFWWSKTSYIKTLKKLEYDEKKISKLLFWICENEQCKLWSYYSSSIDFEHDSNTQIDRETYYGLENLNLNFVRKNDIKKYNKHELFEKAYKAYTHKDIILLNVICDEYLKHFIDLKDEETQKIIFWSGFSNFNINPKKSKQQFKLIYNTKISNESLLFFTKCNLDLLYKNNNNLDSIPKIIHLIYFKGIEFMKFHCECIKSMLEHMPNYTIIIYNDIEPENNNYWNYIKNCKNVKIENMEPPDTFDNYPLKYIQYKADVSRLEILYKYGGIYLDLDMLIIKNFENIFNTNMNFYISEENEKNGGLINSFLACKPNNGFIKKWLDSFKSGLRMDKWAYHIRDSNKLLLDKKKHYLIKYKIEILESKYFFPFKWNERDKFINIKNNLNNDIYGIHLFETILHDILVDNKYFDNSKLD